MRLARASWSLAAFIVCFAARGAVAAVYEVTAQTEAQAYEIRAYGCPQGQTTNCGDPYDPTLLPRRLVVQSIGLSGIELVRDQDVSFDSQLRLWTDFGITSTESQKIDSFPGSGAQLLFAYVTWKDLFNLLDVRVGRQFFTDELDFIDFDGAHLKLRIGRWASLEAFGGMEVTGPWYLGSAVFQPDGTRESDQRRLGLQETEGVNLGALDYLNQPAFVIGGRASLNLWGLGDLRIGYQRTMSEGTVETEHAGASVRLHPIRGLNVFGMLDYDLVLLQLTRGQVGATWTTSFFGVTLEAQRIAPYFTSDSIWAYFAFAPRDEIRLRADLTPSVGPFRYFVEALVQKYNSNLQGTPETVFTPYPVTASPVPTDVSLGGRGGIALALPDPWRADADASYTNGWGGRQFWANVHGGVDLDRGRFMVDLRGSAASIRDAFNPNLAGTFLGANLQLGAQLVKGVKLTGIVEENTNPYTRQDFRVYGVLDVGILL